MDPENNSADQKGSEGSQEEPPQPPSRYWLLLWPIYVISLAWGFGAIVFDGPFGGVNTAIACVWAAGLITILSCLRCPKKRSTGWAIAFAVVLLPWLLKSPSNQRNWDTGWNKVGHVVIDKDTVTFHNLRNFSWSQDGTPTERWDTRIVQLSNLRAVDYFQDNFGGDNWAHPMMSFDFGPDGHVAMSIEARREVGESYSPLAGLYKTYELQYIFAEERDVVLTRTNVRKEPVYLYRTAFSPKAAREFFLQSVAAQNALLDKPRFYHAIAANCTTSLRRQAPKEEQRSLDKRMLMNGRLDEMLHELGQLVPEDIPFAQLRPQALINTAAEAAHEDPEFSNRIREGRPGFADKQP